MDRTHTHLLDLPDQILLTILKKLDNIDVLYSLLGIDNERLDHLAQNTVFTNTLSFVLTPSTNYASSINSQILDRLCNYVLPRISYNVKCIIAEPLSLKRILLSSSFPNLTRLEIYNFESRTTSQYFTDDLITQHIFKHQLTDLIIINHDKYIELADRVEYSQNLYGRIFIILKNLMQLTVMAPSSSLCPPLTLVDLPSTFFSSSCFTALSIAVNIFDDCLFLLDGRLNQLSTFIVEVLWFPNMSYIGYNRNNLPTLKFFSLICRQSLVNYNYEDRIVPLIRRMQQLEKLTLYILLEERSTFIDGSHLHNNILIYLLRLQSFKFYVNTKTQIMNTVRQLSSNDIQQTFTYKGYQQASCIQSNYSNIQGLCHIFSVPFEFKHLLYIDNKFPDIVFNCVTCLEVSDIIPFEHEFFIRIARAFPILKKLSIMNLWRQNNCYLKNNSLYTVAEYPHLVSLVIIFAHRDYIEQFLMETKTYLPRLNELKVRYAGLECVTENFTRNVTRRNCTNVKQLIIDYKLTYIQNVYSYFPSL